MKVSVYNNEAKAVSEFEVPESISTLKWNPVLVQQVVVAMDANARGGAALTKDRGAVRGGGKKPWAQKGTGRARHGSNRSPIWVGGGVTHGPVAEKDYSKKINKKMRRKALQTVLAEKLRDSEVTFLEDIVFSEGRTKAAADVLNKLKKAKVLDNGKLAILLDAPDEATARALRNIPRVTVLEARNLNVRAALNHKNLLLTEKGFHGII